MFPPVWDWVWVRGVRACTPHCVFWWRSLCSSSGSEWVSERATQPGARYGEKKLASSLPRQVSPISSSTALLLLLVCCERVRLSQNTCTADGDLWGAQGQGDGRSIEVGGIRGVWRRGGAEEREEAINTQCKSVTEPFARRRLARNLALAKPIQSLHVAQHRFGCVRDLISSGFAASGNVSTCQARNSNTSLLSDVVLDWL